VLLLLLAAIGGLRRDAGTENEDGAAAPPAMAPAERSRPGESLGSLTIDGRDRGWRLYVPRSLPDAGDAPLVVGLHGGLGSGEQFAADARFDEQAERGSFIAVYPDGVARGRLIEARTWNAGNCCGAAMDQDVDDVAFIEALIDRLTRELPVDPDRVYVTGHSNGAMMVYRLACELSDRVAAIAVVAGSLEAPCSPLEPVSILSIHGDADENHPLEGGTGPRSISRTDCTSVADSIARWGGRNGCAGGSALVVDGPVRTERWSDCDDGTEVASIVVAGASHSWPGGASNGPLRPDPSEDLSASDVAWDFLSTKTRG
jgi:polyhydroxybutyrate depolymerase